MSLLVFIFARGGHVLQARLARRAMLLRAQNYSGSLIPPLREKCIPTPTHSPPLHFCFSRSPSQAIAGVAAAIMFASGGSAHAEMLGLTPLNGSGLAPKKYEGTLYDPRPVAIVEKVRARVLMIRPTPPLIRGSFSHRMVLFVLCVVSPHVVVDDFTLCAIATGVFC